MSFVHNQLADGVVHDCDGTPVIEYSETSTDGTQLDHWHCPKCGAWATAAGSSP